MQRRHTLALLAAALAPHLHAAGPDGYPNKPVRLVVGYPPGGAADIFGRMVASHLASKLGQQVVVENRPGASGTIAASQVARTAGDGYTLYLASAGDFTLARSSFGSRLQYDPERDFTPLSLLVKVPSVLVVHPSVQANTLQELIALAKAKPGELNYASFGNGSTSHIAAEAFNLASGIRMQHVVYKGSGPAMTDLLAGRVQVMFDSVTSATRFTKTGQLRALAVSTLQRVPLVPDTPTIADSGVPGYQIASWMGIVAPAGLPAPIARELAGHLDSFLKDADVRTKLDGLGLVIDGSSLDAFSAFIRQESARMDGIIKSAGIKFD